MNTNMKSKNIEDLKVRFSTLWIVVMINILSADVFSFMLPDNNTPVQITQMIMLVFAIILEIPIAMIFLSRVLRQRANCWANIIASVITTAYIIAGGMPTLHYFFFAAIEIIAMAAIIGYAWRWMNSEAQS